MKLYHLRLKLSETSENPTFYTNRTKCLRPISTNMRRQWNDVTGPGARQWTADHWVVGSTLVNARDACHHSSFMSRLLAGDI